MPEQNCEISWFSALCDDDYEFLGAPDPYLKSSWEHCRNIVTRAEEGGFDNILLPSGYSLGLDTTAFAAAVATQVPSARSTVSAAAPSSGGASGRRRHPSPSMRPSTQPPA